MPISRQLSQTMTSEEIAFYVTFGKRLAQSRQKQGLSQTQLGEILGFSQQTITALEKGRRRVPVSALLPLAKTLGMSVNALLGEPAAKPGKRGPAPKLQQQLERLGRLPKNQQKFVSDMLDTVLEKAS